MRRKVRSRAASISVWSSWPRTATCMLRRDRPCGYLVRLRNVREPARRRRELHDYRTEEQLRLYQTWGCDQMRCEARPRWPHDASVGRDCLRRGRRQAHSPLPMHADDPLPALKSVRRKAISSYNSLPKSYDTESELQSIRRTVRFNSCSLMPGVRKV